MRSLWCGILLALAFCAPFVAVGQVPPADRTADMPDSWLVLYNINNADSIEWVNWYCQQWNIPAANVLGLDASLDEHLPNRAAAEQQIIGPVQALFAGDPAFETQIMGIILGFGLPSHFGQPPIIPDVGGYSIANALQDLSNTVTQEVNWECPHMVPPYGALPSGGRLTKASLLADHYLVAQIDGETIEEARLLTTRARWFMEASCTANEDAHVWYDYLDSAMPSGEWRWLKKAVQGEAFTDVPWAEFDADTQQTPNDAIRFGTHDLTGWDDGRLFGEPAGVRILAFNFNSWGATTVRSCSCDGARYVCNAIAAGYAAAIGATGEPQCCLCPFPDTLIASLREGWTLGEAFYLANPYDDWMWTVLGDPLLRLPCWLDYSKNQMKGDINGDAMVNKRDLAGFAACMKGPGKLPPDVCSPFDFDDDQDCDSADYAALQLAFTGGLVVYPTGDSDGNGRVDLADFQALLPCTCPPGPHALDMACQPFDMDFDLDVDLSDFGTFQRNFSTDPEPVIGDFDGDRDVDLVDLQSLQECYSGSAGTSGYIPPVEACLTAFDYEGEGSGYGDGDIDLLDWQVIIDSVLGPEGGR